MLQETKTSHIGRAVRRREDPALLAGAGRFIDDLTLPGMLHLAVVRSPYAKARILRIDVEAARSAPGVEAVISAADLTGLKGMPINRRVADARFPRNPVLAEGTVLAVGVPVAAVVADSPARARDAADLIEVEYDPLPPVTDVEGALEPDAPTALDEFDSNVFYSVRREGGDVEKAFGQAAHVVSQRIDVPRVAPLAIETRCVAAEPRPFGRGATVWMSTQGPHRARTALANVLGIPDNHLRVIAPDVGGGFGSKGPLYREDVLVTFLALRLGRPVKWVASRSEDMASTSQGRGMIIHAELAVQEDGTMTGLRVRALADVGAYPHNGTPGPPTRLLSMSPGAYRIPNVEVEVTTVFTNRLSTSSYRGAGRPESTLLIERLVEKSASVLGMDPVTLRRKNFIQPDQFPYRNATRAVYDSGNFEGALDRALSLAGYQDLVRRREQKRARGELFGIGLSTFVEPAGNGMESGLVRVEPSGRITAVTGSSAHGQGHETVFAQVVAEQLGVPLDAVVVLHGDTEGSPQGVGTHGSRSGSLGGSALVIASQRVLEKARRMAAHLLEVSPEDLEFDGGSFGVRGAPDRVVTWKELAAAAYRSFELPEGDEPGLEATAYFERDRGMYSFGAHLAVVSVDRQTGRLTLEKLVCVDDCGVILNPLIVEGQVLGGVAQGLGQALMEQVVFGDEGQIVSGSLADYAVPRATDIPPMNGLIVDHTTTPSPNNPLGAKGVGESGTTGAPAAILNAAVDALSPLGVRHLDMPLTANYLWHVIHEHGD